MAPAGDGRQLYLLRRKLQGHGDPAAAVSGGATAHVRPRVGFTMAATALRPARLARTAAEAFQLPHRLTHHVEYQAVPVAFDLEFDLPGLNRLAAQGAEPSGAIAAPHAPGRFAWQFTACDAFACEGSQFLFVLGLRHSSGNCPRRVAEPAVGGIV